MSAAIAEGYCIAACALFAGVSLLGLLSWEIYRDSRKIP